MNKQNDDDPDIQNIPNDINTILYLFSDENVDKIIHEDLIKFNIPNILLKKLSKNNGLLNDNVESNLITILSNFIFCSDSFTEVKLII